MFFGWGRGAKNMLEGFVGWVLEHWIGVQCNLRYIRFGIHHGSAVR